MTEHETREQLVAEGAKLGLRFDGRYSIERMEREIKAARAAAGDVSMEIERLRAEEATVDGLAAREQKAALDAALRQNAAPAGTMTTAAALEERERAELMEQIHKLGISQSVPKGGGIDALREHISRHIAAKAQAQAVLEEQDRRARLRPADTLVSVRVLPMGDGKISRGVHIPGIGDSRYGRGEIFEIGESIAIAQERNGYVEIIGG